jgi:hypothetical protein
MSTVTVMLLDSFRNSIKFYDGSPTNTATALIQAGEYSATRTFSVDGFAGVNAAEEVFDLSNNPMREEERHEKYGPHRSLSVGDMVVVDGVSYVCCPFGWEEVSMAESG